MRQWKMGERGSRLARRLAALGLTAEQFLTPLLQHAITDVSQGPSAREKARLRRGRWQEHLSPPKLTSALPFTFLHPPKLNKNFSTKFIFSLFFSPDSFWKGSVNFRCWMLGLLVDFSYSTVLDVKFHICLVSLFSLLWNVFWMGACRLAFFYRILRRLNSHSLFDG